MVIQGATPDRIRLTGHPRSFPFSPLIGPTRDPTLVAGARARAAAKEDVMRDPLDRFRPADASAAAGTRGRAAL